MFLGYQFIGTLAVSSPRGNCEANFSAMVKIASELWGYRCILKDSDLSNFSM